MKGFALIPARGGSKRVPKKNISLSGGFPLIAYAIAAAHLAKRIGRIIVSTDSEEIAEIARRFGAEVPFMRPDEFARDDSPDLEFLTHALSWLRDNEGSVPEYLVELRATTPLRHPQDIDAAIELFHNNKTATSLRSGFEIQEPAQKLFGIEDGRFVGLFPDDTRPEYYNLPRQAFPPSYQLDGYVDILKASHIEEERTQHGERILAFVSPQTGEVDHPRDFEFIEYKLNQGKWEVYEWLKTNFS